jgi:hypothetical protein
MMLGFSKKSDYRWFSLAVMFFAPILAQKTPQKTYHWVANP